jgi:tRNA nucleotidyltransferase (CCA-adding enzyme)
MINRSKAEYVCKKVLSRIVPSQDERDKLDSIITFAKKSVEDELKKQDISADLVVGGSIGKDTWLKGTHDVDIFVRFDEKYDEIKLGEILGKVIISVFPKAQVAHGSRDYYQLQLKGYKFEFVPVLRIEKPEQAKNSMDASPFHVKYVRNHSRINNLADEIRLFKSFARAHNVYGAESYISGFSGYVSEILVINYGGFCNLIEAFENLQPKILVDPEKHYKDMNEVCSAFSESKLKSPLIVIDPVLKIRNAAAALDYNAFSALLLAMRRFIRDPSESFFAKVNTTISDLEKLSRKRGTIFISRQIKQTDAKEDIFFAKLRSKLDKIRSELERHGIEVYSYGFIKEPSVEAYFEIETLEL